jgi:hypothetical protein
MKNLSRILNARGGIECFRSLKIERPPYMPLCIERIMHSDYYQSPAGDAPLLSVCHYGEQYGDMMRDPEMVFAVVTGDLFPYLKLPKADGLTFVPLYFRNDYMPVEQVIWRIKDGRTFLSRKLLSDLCSFCRTWDRNIGQQGFVSAAAGMEVARA